MAQRLLLIDASSSIFRAFYALPALRNAAGVPTNATLGFLTMLQKVLREANPDGVVVVWDAPGRKRRKELYAEYKATRDATPEDLRAQFEWIRRAVDAYGLATMEYEGEEADDVIATLTRQAVEAGIDVEIVSTDKDLMQLVSDRVTLLDTMKDRRIGPEQVVERFGVPPEQILDLRAIVGDSSDNIPGVKGIGEKGAANLMHEYGSLDAILDSADQVKAKRAREALQTYADDARLSRELSRLREDLPIELDSERARIPEPDTAALTAIFRELELKRLLDGLGAAATPAAPPPADVETAVVPDRAALEARVALLASEPRIGLAVVLEPEEPMRGKLVGIALAGSGARGDFVPLVSAEPSLAPEPTTALDEAEALETLRPLLERDGAVWTGIGLKRLAVALAHRGVELRGELRDVSVQAYVLDPSQQVQRLEALARSYLGREIAATEDVFGKGAKRRAFDSVDAVELASHFGAQAAVALDLSAELDRGLAESGQTALFDGLELPLVQVLARMELAGVRIDEPHLARLGSEIESDLLRIERRIYELAGEPFKINSPKQLQRILFEKLALPPAKKTKTGFSTDESVLEELALEHEIPAEILAWRRLAKLKSTYVDALPTFVHPETGRIHCQFNQTVAATGRLAASNPNLQNIPIRTPLGQRIRAAFVPAEGRVLVSADYSQIELRILAHLCGDEALIEAFLSGEDIHVQTAARVFDIEPEAVSDEQRSQIKAINFGILYGSSAFGIARTLGIGQADAQKHIDAYFERYPRVRALVQQSIENAREKGYAETLWGRRRYLPDLQSRNRVLRQAAERMANNSVIQGTAADLIKRAMVEIDADLRAPGAPRARMILQVHDELVFEVVPEDARALRERVAERMQGVAELCVPLEVHMGEGRNWLEAH
ncbi:MAG: DNA polymerase I [Deltaproteobacteria bacterium]|nr:DNA polymerase I [Deltaproteobacteria bacterium]